MRSIVAKSAPEDVDRPSNGAAASLIDNVEVTLEAYLGKSQLKISDVRALKPDSLITLDAGLGAEVELRLNGAVIARGELVAAGDKFGVRLTEIGR
jgi:flagellar motor switch protein FliN/FliY